MRKGKKQLMKRCSGVFLSKALYWTDDSQSLLACWMFEVLHGRLFVAIDLLIHVVKVRCCTTSILLYFGNVCIQILSV